MDEDEDETSGHGLDAIRTGDAKGPWVEVHVLWGEVWRDVVRAAPGEPLGLGDAIADEVGPLLSWAGETPIVVPPSVGDGEARALAELHPGARLVVACFPFQLVVQRAEPTPARVMSLRPDPIWSGVTGVLGSLGAAALFLIATSAAPPDTLKMAAAMALERPAVQSYFNPEPWAMAIEEATRPSPDAGCPKASLPRGDRLVQIHGLSGGCAAVNAVLRKPDALLACFGGEAVGSTWEIPVTLDISSEGRIRSASSGGDAPTVVQRCVVAALRKLHYSVDEAAMLTARVEVVEPGGEPSTAGSS